MSTETHDFVGYEPTVKDPGPALTVWTVILCILINCSLPILVWLANRWDRQKNAKADSEGDGKQEEDTGRSEKMEESPRTASIKNSTPSKPVVFPFAANKGSHDHDRSTKEVPCDDDVSIVSNNTSTAAAALVVASVLNARPHGHRRKLHMFRKSRGATSRLPYSVPDQGSEGGVEIISLKDFSVASQLDDRESTNDDFITDPAVPVIPVEEDTNESKDDNDSSLWSQLLSTVEWDFESRRLLTLTIPYTIQGCAEGLFQIVNIAVIGNYAGTMQANAYVVTTILLEFSGTLTYGFGEAVGTLVPQAEGAGNPLLVGRYLQLSLLMYCIMSLPAILIWSLWTESAVIWFGFDEETARISQEFAYPFLVIMCLGGFDHSIHEYLSCTGREKFSTGVQIVYYLVECLGVVVAVALGSTNLLVIGIIQAALGLFMTVLNFAYVVHQGWLDHIWEGFTHTLSLKDRRAVHTMMITAIPLSISWLLTYGEWEVLTIFAGAMGPAEVAAWGMLGFVWDTFENLTAGFADAAEVRIGFHMGSGQPRSAKIAAAKSMYMAVVAAVVSTSILFILSQYIPGWLTPDPTLQTMIFEVIPLMGFGQILLIVGTVSWGIVGAQGRVRLATCVEFISSWFVAIPLSVISLYVLNFNLVGFAASLVFGYTAGGIVLGFIILRSDWRALSQTVISRNAIEGISWDDNDWEELPPHVQNAALVLGYTKQLWDSDTEPSVTSKDWKELAQGEKEAARILGYNRKTWDDESSSSSTSNKNENESETGKMYDDTDWEDLPKGVQEAAKVLGYDQDLWDNDGSPKSEDKWWRRLSPEEQDAARTLGYTEQTWDDDSSSDSSSSDDS